LGGLVVGEGAEFRFKFLLCFDQSTESLTDELRAEVALIACGNGGGAKSADFVTDLADAFEGVGPKCGVLASLSKGGLALTFAPEEVASNEKGVIKGFLKNGFDIALGLLSFGSFGSFAPGSRMKRVEDSAAVFGEFFEESSEFGVRTLVEFSALADPEDQLPDFVNFGRGLEDDFILVLSVESVVDYGAKKKEGDQGKCEGPDKRQEKKTCENTQTSESPYEFA
jgi:hypothetical protein